MKFGLETLGGLDILARNAVIVAVVAVLLVLLMILLLLLKPTHIKSDRIIEPRLEIVVDNGKVDTTFIYEKP